MIWDHGVAGSNPVTRATTECLAMAVVKYSMNVVPRRGVHARVAERNMLLAKNQCSSVGSTPTSGTLVVSRATQWMDLTHPVSLLREGSRLCIASGLRTKKVTHFIAQW